MRGYCQIGDTSCFFSYDFFDDFGVFQIIPRFVFHKSLFMTMHCAEPTDLKWLRTYLKVMLKLIFIQNLNRNDHTLADLFVIQF